VSSAKSNVEQLAGLILKGLRIVKVIVLAYLLLMLAAGTGIIGLALLR
jgi:hypothetical protein